MSETPDWVEEVMKEKSGRPGDHDLDCYTHVTYEQSHSDYSHFRNAAHAMIYAKDKRILWPDRFKCQKHAAIMVSKSTQLWLH